MRSTSDVGVDSIPSFAPPLPPSTCAPSALARPCSSRSIRFRSSRRTTSIATLRAAPGSPSTSSSLTRSLTRPCSTRAATRSSATRWTSPATSATTSSRTSRVRHVSRSQGFERRDSRSPWATHATASRHARGHRHPQERLHHRWPERPGCRPQVGREGDHQCVRPSAKPQAIADSRGTSAQTSASSATRS
jgi:hypothetical protein